MIWETEQISALVDEALSSGSSRIELGSHRDARLFRMAVYNRFYAKKQKSPLLIEVDDRTVTIKRR